MRNSKNSLVYIINKVTVLSDEISKLNNKLKQKIGSRMKQKLETMKAKREKLQDKTANRNPNKDMEMKFTYGK